MDGRYTTGLFYGFFKLLRFVSPPRPIDCAEHVLNEEIFNNHLCWQKILIDNFNLFSRFSKLGFNHSIFSMLTPFDSLVSNGGFVSEIFVEIVRKYPIVFARFGQTGSTTFVSEKVEEKSSKLRNGVEEKAIEDIYIQVQKEFELIHSNKSRRRSDKRLKMSDKQIR